MTALRHSSRQPAPSTPPSVSRSWMAPEGCFLEHGFDGASVNDIVKATGVSKGTVSKSGRISGAVSPLVAPVLPEPGKLPFPSKRKGCGRRLPRASADLLRSTALKLDAQQRLPRGC